MNAHLGPKTTQLPLRSGFRARVASGWSAGLPHMAVASVAVSGAAYVQQVILARLLGPAEFGIVRTVETILVVLLMVGSLGTPTLAVRFAPELDDVVSGALLRQLLLLVVCGTSAVTAIVVAWSVATEQGSIASALRLIVWSIIFAGAARVIFGFQQGRLDVRRIAGVVIAVALVSTAATSLFAARFGINGWVAGRLAGDALLMGASIWVARKHIFDRAGATPYSNKALVAFGSAITLSFALRAGVDACALIVLNLKNVDAAEIGYFGLGTLIGTAVMVVPGAFGALVLPRMIKRKAIQPGPQYMWWAMRWSLAFSLPVCLLLMLSAPFLLRITLPQYAPGALVIALLISLAPLRACGAMAGNQLLAHSNVRATIAFNAIGAVLVVVLGLLMVERNGIVGVALALLLTEAVIFALTTHAAIRQTNRVA